MNYSKRIRIAAALSVLLHILCFEAWKYFPAPPVSLVSPVSAPIELDLQPEPPSNAAPTQLVDVTQPSPELPSQTPLIAEQNSEAMDDAPPVDDAPTPKFQQDDFNELAAMPAPPAEPAPQPSPEVAEQDSAKPEEAPSPAPSKQELERMETQLEAVELQEEASNEPASSDASPIKVAQADAQLPQRPSPGRSTKPTGVSKRGVTNFDAIQNEIAPYLKQVRERVEREWNAMLYTRYTGTSPVKAVIDCAISPTGELISVSVSGAQNDRIYSALCKEAVQRAGPFGPFTFEVPDMYREKNLEIRWTFSFL